MKTLTYIGLIIVSYLFVACEPLLEDTPDIGPAPAKDQLSFTITPGADDFTFVFTNTSSVVGMAKWDFGNGVKAQGDKVTNKFALKDTYTVTMSLYTSGGNASVSKEHTTTKTDFSIFTDAKYINLSGGIEMTEGKIWVVDSISKGHFGIGPANGDWPEWWSADPIQKTHSGAYDDEFIFKIQGFDFGFMNNGDSYVKNYRKNDPNYSNPVELYGEPDCRVSYSPGEATWSIVTKDDADYIVLTSPTPVFFGFDYGAVDNAYRIEELTETHLSLSCIGGDGNRWYNTLIPKGYTNPTVSYAITTTETGGENEWSLSLTDITIPEGISVLGYTVDFGDGSALVDVEDYTEAVTHVYMRKGNYPVSVTVKSTNGNVEQTSSVSVADYHSEYEPFLLDMMVIYVDNSEIEMAPVNGENCGVTVVANPDRTYPNKGANVFHYIKENQEWANAYMKLPVGYRFNLTKTTVFRIMVRGKAGQQVLLKLENTDRGGNAWQTGAELIYTIQADDTWEMAEYDFAGVSAGWDWTGDIFTSDISTDTRFNTDFYNIVRIMLNPGVGQGVHEFHFDDLAGPHVEGLKSTRQ